MFLFDCVRRCDDTLTSRALPPTVLKKTGRLLSHGFFSNGASGSLAVKALGYKPEGREFETR
jgi:hypothetical protein